MGCNEHWTNGEPSLPAPTSGLSESVRFTSVNDPVIPAHVVSPDDLANVSFARCDGHNNCRTDIGLCERGTSVAPIKEFYGCSFLSGLNGNGVTGRSGEHFPTGKVGEGDVIALRDGRTDGEASCDGSGR